MTAPHKQENWEELLEEKYYDGGDSRYGYVKHNNTVLRNIIDDFKEILTKDRIQRDEFWKAQEMGKASDCAEHERKFREELVEKVKEMKYIFTREKDDYLPEVYKHLRSKNEALDSVLALLETLP